MNRARPSKQIKAIIFDFDGTIADSFEVFVNVLQQIIKRNHPLTYAEIEDLRSSSLNEIIKKLGVKKWQIPFLLVSGKREIKKQMYKVKVFDGLAQVLNELDSRGFKIYILSTNAESSIREFLLKHKLNNFITGIYADIGLWGKALSLSKLQRREKLTKEECVYIGDETRDIEAAKKAQIKCIAVAWGFSSPEALKSSQPSAIVNIPKDIIKMMLQFEG